MHQPGFFDLARRYDSLDAKPDPLVGLNKLVPWDDFRAPLRAALEQSGLRVTAETRKTKAGRKPWDEIVMFKVLILQSLYNLGDDQVEFLIRDRLSFMRFLGLGLEDNVPDAKTVWLYREALAKSGTARTLFEVFETQLKKQGYLAMGGQIVDATIVPVPKNRNTEEENAAIKAGETPKGWEDHPAKLRQKDLDARWTKKARAVALWLQEPRQHRPQAQAGAGIHCHRRGASRQSGRGAGYNQHRIRRVGGQRVSVRRDRGETEGERPAQPRASQGEPAAQAVEAGETGQQDALESSRQGRACVRHHGYVDGWQAGAHDRDGAGAHQDRAAEPDL